MLAPSAGWLTAACIERTPIPLLHLTVVLETDDSSGDRHDPTTPGEEASGEVGTPPRPAIGTGPMDAPTTWLAMPPCAAHPIVYFPAVWVRCCGKDLNGYGMGCSHYVCACAPRRRYVPCPSIRATAVLHGCIHSRLLPWNDAVRVRSTNGEQCGGAALVPDGDVAGPSSPALLPVDTLRRKILWLIRGPRTHVSGTDANSKPAQRCWMPSCLGNIIHSHDVHRLWVCCMRFPTHATPPPSVIRMIPNPRVDS